MKILQHLRDNCNIYHRLTPLMKLDTHTYYNLRLILELEFNEYITSSKYKI